MKEGGGLTPIRERNPNLSLHGLFKARFATESELLNNLLVDNLYTMTLKENEPHL